MTGSRPKDSCRNLFTKLEILPLPSLYIFNLLRFVRKNKEFFITNETHNYDTRQCADLQYPSVKLKKFQTGAHYMGIKIYSYLPTYIKIEINNAKKFDQFLKKFLLDKSFYSLEEFCNLDYGYI